MATSSITANFYCDDAKAANALVRSRHSGNGEGCMSVFNKLADPFYSDTKPKG